ncbi:hypothetical protein [Gimesia alba]|uniref:hypothetical protein n=1 Tax=Gimesia alba TaxID=2527973 RepID=UPI0011A7D0E3|nr:hypothetical protein [Gimesia alba]
MLNDQSHLLSRLDTGDDHHIWILYPSERLFDDFLEADEYPPGSEELTETERRDIDYRIHKAFALIDEFSKIWANEIRCVIGTIAVLPTCLGRTQRHFNCRTPYCGVIFVNAFGMNETQIAEAILHESIHQLLWQGWELHPEFQVSAEHADIQSPVTGNVRSVQVMSHAMLIYTATIELLTHTIRTNEYLDYAGELRSRVVALKRGIRVLNAQLSNLINMDAALEILLDNATPERVVQYVYGLQAVK